MKQGESSTKIKMVSRNFVVVVFYYFSIIEKSPFWTGTSNYRKDVIINFLSIQLVNKNINGDSRVNKAVHDHYNSFQERFVNNVNNNLPLIQCNNSNNKKEIIVIIIGDSMLNNINSRGLSKSKKVSVSNFPGATSEDILAEVGDTLKTHPDTLTVHAGTNYHTKNINTLRGVMKLCEKSKSISPDTKNKDFFEYNLPEGQTKHR